MRVLFHEVLDKNKNSSIYSGEKNGSGFTGPRPKNHGKMALVLIYGRLYITAYPQGNIFLESQTRMVFNEVLGKIFTYYSFSRSAKKKWEASGFGLKVMLGGYLFVSGHCTLQLSCENTSNIE